MTPTEAAFHRAMMGLYKRSKKEIHYNATYFLRMLDDHGGVETAHRLLEPHSAVSDGFTTLVLEKRLESKRRCSNHGFSRCSVRRNWMRPDDAWPRTTGRLLTQAHAEC
jgi:hypothetical protein